MRLARYIFIALSLLLLDSCVIDNNFSMPKKEASIVGFEVEGQISASIDQEKRHVEVVLDESADITSLKLKGIEFNEGVYIVGDTPEYLDLSQTVSLTLMAYKEYTWTISAVQPVERYIKVENQVGKAEFHTDEKTAYVFVNENQRLNAVTFLDMKLEPVGSEVVSTTGISYVNGSGVEETLDCVFPMTLPCVMLRTFDVSYKGETLTWTVSVQIKKIDLEVTSVNAFARHAELQAAYDGKGEPVFEYRKASETAWNECAESTVAEMGLSGVIRGLEPDTDYVVRVRNGENHSVEYAFRTEKEEQLYNMNFDQWWQSGRIWYPCAQGADPSVWDSANPGAATFIGSTTVPEETFVKSGKAVRMESQYAVIAFAAGNIYTGKFGRVSGVGAELDWGVPFTSRPTSLKGYYSYAPELIDNKYGDKDVKEIDNDKLEAGNHDPAALLGSTDKCQIQVILTDWDAPFRINTTAGQFVDIESDPAIIAYGKLESDRTTDGYESFVIDLEYRDKTRKPKYVVISACASYLGDYFTGGVGSTMYIDEFEFVY